MRTCEHCGNPIPLDRKTGSIYCSSRCNKAAWRKRTKDGKPRKAHEKKPVKKAGDKVSVDLTSGVVADLRLEDFERMMDDSVEDTLRFTRNILKHTLEQGLAPANTLAPISKQLIEIAKELEARTGGDIFTDDLSDDSEVSEEVFDLGSI